MYSPVWRRMLCVIAVAAMSLAGVVQADDTRDYLFGEADKAYARAQEANAKLLSPRNFERAFTSYQRAEQGLSRGRNLDRLRKDIDQSILYFGRAVKAAEFANVTLASLIKTRSDAKKVNSMGHAAIQWQRAETRFRQAMTELESGDIKFAQKRAREAQAIYRDAELISIKVVYLDETEKMIDIADKGRIRRFAPRSVEKAKILFDQAERELTENRYDTDLPRSLAQEAAYEARHAIYIADLREYHRKNRITGEELILEMEKPLIRVSESANLVAHFDRGYDGPADQIILYINTHQGDAQSFLAQVQVLELEMDDRIAQIDALQAEIAKLDARLGGAAREKSLLAQRLEAQARVRAQFKQIEVMFPREEAHVFRELSDVVIRLTGLSFPVGNADVQPGHRELLRKVEDAIRVFPRSEFVIEGHTDFHGGDDANYILSQERADSVKAYFVSDMHISVHRISSVGYGETRPVANNETSAGRAKNRRIDIRIIPNLDVPG